MPDFCGSTPGSFNLLDTANSRPANGSPLFSLSRPVCLACLPYVLVKQHAMIVRAGSANCQHCYSKLPSHRNSVTQGVHQWCAGNSATHLCRQSLRREVHRDTKPGLLPEDRENEPGVHTKGHHCTVRRRASSCTLRGHSCGVYLPAGSHVDLEPQTLGPTQNPWLNKRGASASKVTGLRKQNGEQQNKV
jgi:hypothetical protein